MAIHDVNATTLILRTADVLEKEQVVTPADWAPFVRTGNSRERPPMQDNWWYIRSAAVLRKIFLHGPIGTLKLKVKFGGKKNNGNAPEHFAPGAGNHIRKMLQQFEKAGLVRQTEKGSFKGRVLTPKGQQLLERVATEIMKEEGTEFAKIPNTELKGAEEKPKKKAKKAKKKTAKKAPAKKAEEKPTKKETKVEKKEAPAKEESKAEKAPAKKTEEKFESQAPKEPKAEVETKAQAEEKNDKPAEEKNE